MEPFILHIETSTQVCSVALSKGKDMLCIKESTDKNAHSALIALYVSDVLTNSDVGFRELSAISVGIGPGSYTGLRIGVSTAKGFGYALDKPLLGISPLQAMAYRASQEVQDPTALFIPMTDAGRMEVYAGVYDANGNEIRSVQADVIDENSYLEYLQEKTVYFMGNGMPKCQTLLSKSVHARFLPNIQASAENMILPALEKYEQGDFVDLAYFEPFYLKEFVPAPSCVKGL